MERASSVSPVASCVVQHQTLWLDERDRELIDTHVEECYLVAYGEHNYVTWEVYHVPTQVI
jgi:hypothetical protein